MSIMVATMPTCPAMSATIVPIGVAATRGTSLHARIVLMCSPVELWLLVN
jgi:hypothetical protein